jgi:hypothetical protein
MMRISCGSPILLDIVREAIKSLRKVDGNAMPIILGRNSRGRLSMGVLGVLNTNDALYPVGGGRWQSQVPSGY